MKTPYIWTGPEVDLVTGVTARYLVVLEIKDLSGAKHARGRFTFCDYIEHGIEGSDEWKAVGTKGDAGWSWEIEAVKHDSFWRTQDGKPAFTGSSSIDKAIHAFISSKLSALVDGALADAKARKPVSPDKVLRKETGACVCSRMKAAEHDPLPHEEPCVECSCGKTWWKFDAEKHLWGPVSDPKAWELFLKNGGVETARLTIDPETQELALLQTVREKGYVPIG